MSHSSRSGEFSYSIADLMKGKWKHGVSLVFLLFSVHIFVASSQAQEYSFERVSTPSDNIADLAQDHMGFLWMAGAGLHRYDGYEYVTFRHDPEDSTSLTSNSISNLLVDKEGVLWVAVEGEHGGLHQFHPESQSFTRYQHDPSDSQSLSSNDLFFLYEDRDGILWVGTRDGQLDRFNRSNKTFSSFQVPGSTGIIEHIIEDTSGTLWIGTANGLFTFNKQYEQFTRRNLAEIESVFAIHADREGILWIGSSANTLFRYDPASDGVTRYAVPGVKEDSHVEDIYEDQFGNLWIATWGSGLFRFDRDMKTFINDLSGSGKQEDFISGVVYRLFEDKHGTLWACFIEAEAMDRKYGGLFKSFRSPAPFTVYQHNPDDLASIRENRRIIDFQRDHNGSLWVATLGGGINVFDPRLKKFSHHNAQPGTPDSLQTDDISTLLQDRQGIWWVGGFYPGLHRYDPIRNVFTDKDFHLDKVNEVIESGVISLYEDRQGILWIGTWRSGLIRFDPGNGSITRYNPTPGKPTQQADIVYAIKEDRQGNLWIGTQARGVELRTGSLKRFDRETGTFEQFSEFGASSAFEDSAGNIWVLSLSTGLSKWDVESNAYVRYSQENGLPNNQIICVVEDAKEHLWISSPGGLSRLNHVTGATYYIPFERLPQDFAFAASANACIRDDQGTLYFGGGTGILSFHPDDFYSNKGAPDVALLGFQVGDEIIDFGESRLLTHPIEMTEAVELSHHQNNFAIKYAGLHFENPSRNAYRYKLEPYNDDWIEAGAERWARFFQMPAGEYIFRVQAANPEGLWNEDGAEIAITVMSPWWLRRWAYIFYGIMLIGGLLIANRFQRQRLVRREREQVRVEMAELESRTANERAEMAEHLEEVKSQFFVNLSHEFRTPLTLILGPLRDALGGVYGNLEGQLQHQLQIMQRNGDRLLRLINQLLDFEKLQAGGLYLQARSGDLVSFTRALILSFVSRAEREKKTLTFDATQVELTAYFDHAKLEKVIFNLLANAFDFSESGASIQVRVDVHEATARIQVEDTGYGIAASQLERIFDRFYQVDTSSTRQHEGNGIGLSLAKDLVTLHHGHIKADSQEGEGSIFTVLLPLGRAHLRDNEVMEEEQVEDNEKISEHINASSIEKLSVPVSASEAGKPATILIVEDNDDLRDYLKTHLADYRIVEAENGEQGLQSALNILPDLVISDVMMPIMDGIALCKALRNNEKTQDIPVILLTAKATERHKIEGLSIGVDDYIYKPFSAKELLVRTENLIDLRHRLRSKYRAEIVLKPAEVSVSSTDAAFIEQVRSIVEENMGDSWFGVERLADGVSLSRRQLQRRMNELVKTPAASFIRDMRLARAAQLLEKKAGNVSEIAYAVGYSDPQYFSTLFKKRYGSSPSAYAKQSNKKGK
ncbi:MAG: two-component regulator propeller domain-containing protein [Rhodothermales bacterium]